ncbi:hypothetical protein B0J11DRAFT_550550 [Dendryphion nanum]|uniref:TauD/TfdA-like domain-containing protein n=1 Tax=Dendryphion nanum TaxID=256645 RepID=A0A9P9DRE4_9PLEO|nr:hypothetical protein B0J11DRAFT_550550 [Dendryphion nanum]
MSGNLTLPHFHTALRHVTRATSRRPILRERNVGAGAARAGNHSNNASSSALSKRQFWWRARSAAQPAQPQTPEEDLRLAVGQLDDGKPSKHIAVTIDGNTRTFDTVFLRDSCTCPQCVDPDSKQKLFQTSDIPTDLEGTGRLIEDPEKGKVIEFSWTNDVPSSSPSHRTQHSINWLQRAVNTEIELRAGVRNDERILWDKARITASNKWIDYDTYMSSDTELHTSLAHLHTHGLLFLRNVPDSENSVVEIASRIGNLKDTFYGRTWDVKSKPKAENIAYTPHFLGLHMDLLYTSNPPHLQLLHSLRARAPRGESFFSDSFHAAQRLQKLFPAHFRTLCTFPVTYHYHHENQHYHYTRPTIELHPFSRSTDPTSFSIAHVNYSPPFQAPFEARIGSGTNASLRAYLAAVKQFDALLTDERNLFEYRLEEGECVIFDNRRVLHARRAFDAQAGERWLKGAYVEDDVFFSKLRVLRERFGGEWEAEGVLREAVE